MNQFHNFSNHWFGSWVVTGISVVAFILVLKLLVSRIPDMGPTGAIKAGINAI
jgi:hypothetical protein